MLLCSPSNPTGQNYSREDLEELADVLRKPENQHVYVISDEIYEHIVYDGMKHISFLQAASDLSNRVIIVNGVSKCLSMTGWRIGYAATHNKDMIDLIKKGSFIQCFMCIICITKCCYPRFTI